MSNTDIRYMAKIGTDDRKPKSLKVALTTKSKRDEIYEKKSTLKGENLWITEDLCYKQMINDDDAY